MKPLRIGMIASNFIRIPPDPASIYLPPGASGAPEIIIHNLTEALVKRGHEVTLFASGDSATAAHLRNVTPGATWSAAGIGKGKHLEYERLLISDAYQQAAKGKFDIVHSHFDLQTSYFAPIVKTPTVQTLHSPLNGIIKEILSNYKDQQHYISISDNQRKGLPDLQYAATVYNGVDINQFPFSDEPKGYLVHAGRIFPDKGAAEAIAIAKQTNHKLLLFGSIDETSDYWEKKIKPEIDSKLIFYKGVVARTELFEYLQHAKAFLFPLQWEEPFGLAMIEAMACGTPVIALRKGAVSEVVVDGVSGYVTDSLEEMTNALKKIHLLNRRACRQHVEKHFSIDQMVDGYEQAYYSVVNQKS